MSNRNNGYLLPEMLTGYDLVCLKMQIPDNQLYRAAVVGAITSLTKWWNWERTGDNSGSIAAHYWLDLVLETLEIGPCEEPEPPDAAGAGAADQPGGAVGTFEDFLKLMKELDVKYRVGDQLYEAVIDLVPCGCGDGATGPDGTTPPLAIPGASGGAPYSDLTTLCDAVGPLLGYIPAAVDDYLGTINNVGFFARFSNADFIPLVNDVLESLDAVEAQLTDPTFLASLERVIIQSFNDPWTDINREDLRQFANRIPLLQEGAPMRAAFVLWAETANLALLNTSARSQTGTTSPGDCAENFNTVGRIPFSRSANTPQDDNVTVETYNDGTNDWTIEIQVLNAPYRRATDAPTAIFTSTNRVIAAAGFSTSNWSQTGAGNPARQPILRAGNAGLAFFSAAGQVPVGVDFYVTYNFVPTAITQSAFDDILQIVQGVIGAFPLSPIPGPSQVTQSPYAVDGVIQFGAPFPVNGFSAEVDWVFIVSREV